MAQNKVLLHACCAVCLGYSAKKMLEMGYYIVVFFYNPNIYPQAEYERRKEEIISFCKSNNYQLIVQEDSYEQWLKYINGYEQEPEKGKRCNLCFEYRLEKTKQKAQELGISKITTTLSISPHKVSKNIFEAGQKVCANSGLEFLEIDFKKENGFLKTNEIAKEFGLYRQKYCACEFSVR